MSVMTSDGVIPYKKVKFDGGVISAPVCVDVVYARGRDKYSRYKVFPLRNLVDTYIYALPGGLRITEDGIVFDPNLSVLG